MSAPLYSTFTLFTEIAVSIAILYIFYQGYKKNKFPYFVVVLALGYEIFFNISYMVSRTLSHTEVKASEPLFHILLVL